MPNSSEKQKVTLGQIFVHQETGHVVCILCQKANAGGDFSSGKKWDEWKLGQLKQHLNHKVHAESVEKLCNKRRLLKLCKIVRNALIWLLDSRVSLSAQA